MFLTACIHVLSRMDTSQNLVASFVSCFFDTIHRATFIQKNKFCKGDSIDLLSPGKTGRNFIADDLCSINGEEIESTPHPFMEFKLRVPFDVHEGDILRAGYENT